MGSKARVSRQPVNARTKSSKSRLKAVLFDMDGVVTDTAVVHALAWKGTFDDYLRAHANGKPFKSFDIEKDYRTFVDGKPRIDGVICFLEARGITLPLGRESDGPEAKTAWGLANRKNRRFQAWLETNAVETFAGARSLIETLRAACIKTAIFSASRNAADVLRSAGVLQLFDVKVDGRDLDEKGLPGKPDPAMLHEAARRLNVEPRHVAIVEDSIAGVEAGVRGGFGLVIGVDRTGDGKALRRAGAGLVVANLGEMRFSAGDGLVVKTPATLPRASAFEDEIRARLSGRKPAVFFDYDGTLTPIVEDYRKAFLSPEMRAAVGELAARCAVSIVSGRDVEVVRDLVDLDSLYYAGSHGFEIRGPQSLAGALEKGVGHLPAIDSAERELIQRLAGIAGHAVERKRFSVEVHFRQATDREIDRIEHAVDEVAAKHCGLRKGHGKMVFRLQPDIPLNKGRAVLWLLERLDLRHAHVLPVYVGDDITDEDAFRALAGRGLTLVVLGEDEDRPTAADYALADTDEVRRFIEMLVSFLDARSH